MNAIPTNSAPGYGLIILDDLKFFFERSSFHIYLLFHFIYFLNPRSNSPRSVLLKEKFWSPEPLFIVSGKAQALETHSVKIFQTFKYTAVFSFRCGIKLPSKLHLWMRKYQSSYATRPKRAESAVWVVVIPSNFHNFQWERMEQNGIKYHRHNHLRGVIFFSCTFPHISLRS